MSRRIGAAQRSHGATASSAIAGPDLGGDAALPGQGPRIKSAGTSAGTKLAGTKRADMALIDLANPTRFISLVARVLPWLVAATVLAFAIGLRETYLAPDDYQQGATVKIMFIHVPNAWLCMFVWGVMSVAALGTLVWRHPLADVAAKCAAPLGAAFTFLALVTGSLWGRPMWGTYWVWDARLTSVLVLFLMYLALIALWRTVDDPTRAGRAAAVLTLVGAVNLPIIKFSVDWWNTLHQPASVFRMGGPTVDPSMLVPLAVMAIAFTLLFITLHLAAMRNEILRRRVRTLLLTQAERA
jgi:heme exporter protein C